MKRLIFLIPFFLLFFSNSFSQDTIFMKDKSVVIAKVLEILPDYVKYKKYDNLDGPSYTELKADIMRIVYQNGTIDEFTKSDIPKIKFKNESFNKKAQGIFLAGLTLSTLGGDAAYTKNKQGVAAGLGVDFPFDRSGNYFEFTLYFEHKGSNFSDVEEMYLDDLYKFTETVIDMDYVTLSFMYKRFIGAKKLFYVKAGLYAGYRVSGDIESILVRVSDNEQRHFSASLANVYSKWDAGGTFGAGLNIPISKGDYPTNLVFEARYNLGLSNVFKDSNSSLTEDYRETNQNICFLAGLRFPF